MMDAGTDVAPAAYFADGAGGLGLRTYLGPLVLDQLDAGAVTVTPPQTPGWDPGGQVR